MPFSQPQLHTCIFMNSVFCIEPERMPALATDVLKSSRIRIQSTNNLVPPVTNNQLHSSTLHFFTLVPFVLGSYK